VPRSLEGQRAGFLDASLAVDSARLYPPNFRYSTQEETNLGPQSVAKPHQ
jgi:hypothetical protein